MGEARDAIDPIIELAVKANDKKRLSQIHTILGTHRYMFEEAFEPAYQDLKTALRLAEENLRRNVGSATMPNTTKDTA